MTDSSDFDFCPHVINVFDDIFNHLNLDENTLHSDPIPYAAAEVTGYAHQVSFGRFLLICENLIPYLITENLVLNCPLKTGDWIRAKVGYSSQHERAIVLKIEEVRHIDFEDAPTIAAARGFNYANQIIKLGTTVMVKKTINQDVYAKISTILQNKPLSTKAFILSFDGRPDNYPATAKLFITKPTQSVRDKLTICLLCFFQAKELACAGEDVLIIIDSLDKMFNVFNNCMQKVGLIDPKFISAGAVTDLETILCSSRCLQDQGTLTIVGLHRPGTTAPQQYITDRFYQLFDTII